jgi:hypothetical protein
MMMLFCDWQLSKEVKQLRKYETALLGTYQRFVHQLLASIAPLKRISATKVWMDGCVMLVCKTMTWLGYLFEVCVL